MKIKDIEISIDITHIMLASLAILHSVHYIFFDGGDTSIILSVIFFVGWVLYTQAKDINANKQL